MHGYNKRRDKDLGDGDHEYVGETANQLMGGGYNSRRPISRLDDDRPHRFSNAGWLAGLLAEAHAPYEVSSDALARGEALGLADVVAVGRARAVALVLVALRHAVPRLRHLRRPRLCTHTLTRASWLAAKSSSRRPVQFPWQPPVRARSHQVQD
jgi:hypothetical protein